MRALARHVWPAGLAGRFALVLVCALVAVNLVGFALLSVERNRFDREVLTTRAFDQIVSLVPPLEAVGPRVRRDLARDASGRLSRISVDPRPMIEATGRDSGSRALAAALSEALPEREVRAIAGEGPGRSPRDDRHRDHHDDPRVGSVVISVRLQVDGPAEWLNARSRYFRPLPPEDPVRALLTVPILSLLVVLAVGLIFVRRLTRPLARLAEATRAAGQGDRSIRVPEEGARELRAAAAAFNDMQERIGQFDAERMRTLAAVGHDLRTPITSLRIRAEMLDEAEAQPMIRTLDEMTVMADGLIAYARGSGDAEEVQAIDLKPFLADICEELGARFEADAAGTVAGRPVALRRALGNLIDNAMRYGGDTRVALRGRAGEAVITVEDEGPGIPADRLEAMFDPFVRGEESRSAETGGAGLGLSIARNIFLAHGGTIALENRAEGGLRATVQLPIRDAASEAGAPRRGPLRDRP